MSVVEEILLSPKEDKVKELSVLIKNNKLYLKEVEERILSSDNARLLYLAGIYIEGINLGRLSHSLSRARNSFYILRLAWLINKMPESKEKTSMINDLANGIMQSKVAHNIYYFARDIKGAPVDKLAKSLLKTGDATYIFYTLRDLSSKLSIDTKIKLAHHIIDLKNAQEILSISHIVTEKSLTEYANAMLNAKKDELYGVHLCMFLSEHNLPDGELRTNIINSILESNDYRRILSLILEQDNVPYAEMIDYLLKNEENYQNSNFWLNYILPIAISNKPHASYAVQKIIESSNIEIISITINYLKDEILKRKLKTALINARQNEIFQNTKKEKSKARVRKRKK